MSSDSVVARFEIPYRACLASDGTLCGALPGFASDTLLLQQLYRTMVRARVFDTKAVNLQRTGKLGTYPSCLGHEATHVGAGAAMRAEDVMFTVYREVGAKLWRGVDMLDILLYWGGDERGTIYRSNPQDFPYCVPIGSQMPHAAGAALAFQIRGEARCALVFIGDGGTSQGAFYEALNLAGAKALPLVCVIVNNRWAISVPVTAQTAAQTLAQKAIAAGIPALQVDGNDVLIVRESVAGQEVEAATRVEPIARMRTYLESQGHWSEAAEQALRRECTEAVESAVKQYLATPKQSTDSMFDYLYAQLPAGLRAQRDEARQFAALKP